MAPRPYDATRRRAASQATRARILEAARALIGGQGDITEFSLEAVASRAGVSRMTIYNQFSSRAALLEALADRLAESGGLGELREAFMAPGAEEALRRLVSTFTRFWASDRVTLRRLRAMGVAFPGQEARPRERDAWRRHAIEALLERHERERGPGAQESRNDLVDMLASLTSFETFDSLCTRERSPQKVSELVGALSVQLLELYRARGLGATSRTGSHAKSQRS